MKALKQAITYQVRKKSTNNSIQTEYDIMEGAHKKNKDNTTHTEHDTMKNLVNTFQKDISIKKRER